MEKEKQDKKGRGTRVVGGLTSGFLNGLFGSGGGVVAVLFLRKLIDDEPKAHATATLMILIMSLVSFGLYAANGHVEYKEGLMFLPGGVAGALLGTAFLKNIQSDVLRRVFGGIIALSGAVMLLR